MQTIIIEVRGGVVQDVYSNTTDVKVLLVDWDTDESLGEKYLGGIFPHQKLADLPTKTRDAVMHLEVTS